jgi:hypothetical protein
VNAVHTNGDEPPRAPRVTIAVEPNASEANRPMITGAPRQAPKAKRQTKTAIPASDGSILSTYRLGPIVEKFNLIKVDGTPQRVARVIGREPHKGLPSERGLAPRGPDRNRLNAYEMSGQDGITSFVYCCIYHKTTKVDFESVQ